MLLQQIVNGLILGFSYSLLAIGLTIIFGILRIVNLAHGEMYMLGAFSAFFLINILKLNFFLSVLISMMFVGVLGVILERIAFRPIRNQPEENYFILSFGILIIIENICLLLLGSRARYVKTGYDQVLSLTGIVMTYQRVIVVIVSLIILILFYYFLKKHKIGKAMRATGENYEGASVVGIDINEIASFTFFMGSALAGAAGALIGSIFVVTPVMGFMPLLKAFVVVIFGGLGSISGAIVGGIILAMAEVLGEAYISSEYKDGVAFLILIIILSIKPTGLFGQKVDIE
jgi:branched-chain amino acid transport system permease protein